MGVLSSAPAEVFRNIATLRPEPAESEPSPKSTRVGASAGTPASEEELFPGVLAAVPARVGWSSSARGRSGAGMGDLSLQAEKAVAGEPDYATNPRHSHRVARTTPWVI